MKQTRVAGVSILGYLVTGFILVLVSIIVIPKYISLSTVKKEAELTASLEVMRETIFLYYAAQIEDGKPPHFPHLDSKLFHNESLPKDPYFDSAEVKYVENYPFKETDFENDGGWLYHQPLGEIIIDYYPKRFL